MKIIPKIGIYFAMLFFAAIVGAVYGVVHDQISYTFSNEYFTRFKFIQFSVPWAYESPRLGAAYVGALATWWMGVLVFIPLGLFGFMSGSPKAMASDLSKSFAIVIVVALMTGLAGLIYGYYQINAATISANMQWVWEGVDNPVQFVRVGYMHNASYLGGLTGLIAGIAYLVVNRLRFKN
ncbi:alkaline shock response membrane anchor protein AmaP [Gammaproteobacteria bacterium]|nr:alkaline shock response membrane anchor protein AmaP [Gammaproteobacteria bacterium]